VWSTGSSEAPSASNRGDASQLDRGVTFVEESAVGRDEEALPTGCRGRAMPGKLLQGGRVGTTATMLWVGTRWAAAKVGSHEVRLAKPVRG
jgi:hypothetical protein